MADRGKHQTAFGFETRAIHAGARPEPVTGARNTPIYQTTSYVFEDAEHAADLFNLSRFGFLYSRITNPTISVLEERVASLENGRAAVAAATGHAAQFLTFFTLLEPGDEFVSSRNLYGGSLTQFGLSFKKLGWTCHFVDGTDPEYFRRAITPKTKALFWKCWPIRAVSSSIWKKWSRSAAKPVFRSSSTTPWRPLTCTSPWIGAPTSLSIRPPNI